MQQIMSDYAEDSTVTQYNNAFIREKFCTYAIVYNFRELDRFFIDTPTFKFDSYKDTSAGWYLSLKQRHYHKKPGKIVVKLVHLASNSKIMIRPAAEFCNRLITSMDDVCDVFTGGMFIIEHTHTMYQKRVEPKVRGIESYSDEELLQMLHSRTMSRLGDYRGPRPKPIDLTNVVDLDEIRRIKFDDSVIDKVLAA